MGRLTGEVRPTTNSRPADELIARGRGCRKKKIEESASVRVCWDERCGDAVGNRETDRAWRLFCRTQSEERPRLVSFYRRPQPVAAARQMAANGADREPHRLRYFLIGFTLHASEHHGDALLARQAPEGSGDIAQHEPRLARVASCSVIGLGEHPQHRDKAIGLRCTREELVAHDGEQPGAQIGARLVQMRISQSPQQGVLNEIVGIGLLAMPPAYGATQERDLVFDLPRNIRLVCVAGARFRCELPASRGAMQTHRAGLGGVRGLVAARTHLYTLIKRKLHNLRTPFATPTRLSLTLTSF